jgi:hypothetical protein
MALEQSLFHFVFHLVSDPEQLTAFQSDPAGALADAGLSDINATDVLEVLPLVSDNLPATSGLETLLADLPSTGQAISGIEQLQAVAYAVSSQVSCFSVAGNGFGAAGTFSSVGGEVAGSLAGHLAGGVELSSLESMAGGLSHNVDPAAVLGDLTSLAQGTPLANGFGPLPDPTAGIEAVNAQVMWAVGAVSETSSSVIAADSTGTLASVSEAGSMVVSATTGFTSVSDVAETLDSEAMSNASALTSVAQSQLANPAGTATTLVESVQALATSSLTPQHVYQLATDLNTDGITVASQVQPVLNDVAAGHAPLDDALTTAHSVVADGGTLTGQLGISSLIASNPALAAGQAALTNTVGTVQSHLPLSTVGTAVHNVQTTVNGVLDGTGISNAVSHSPLATAATAGPAVAGQVSADAQHVADTLHNVTSGLDNLHLHG